tara:strand:+ start:3549 stop:3980 length:432 start_codon:yes stop_codon:yes gene_type:complete
MKDTYLRIFSNAKQLVGLPALSAEEIAHLEQNAVEIVNGLLNEGICCGDGNQNAPTFQDQPGTIPGFACCTSGDFIEFPGEGGHGEGPPGAGGFNFTYQANGWLYPYDIDNLQFVAGLAGPGDSVFYPCLPGGGFGPELEVPH